jgi:hypothetical protein
MTETNQRMLVQVKCNLEQALKMKTAGAQAEATTPDASLDKRSRACES